MKYDLQYVDTISPNAMGADFVLTNGLPNDFHYWGLLLDVNIAYTLGVAATTGTPIGFPFTFFDRVLVEGNIQGLGKITLVDAPARALATAAALTSTRFPHYRRDDDPTTVAAHAARFLLPVPFCTIGRMNAAESMVARTLLPGNAFANPIRLLLRTGPNAALGTSGAGTTYTLGTCTVDVHRVIVRLGIGQDIPGQKYISQKVIQGPFNIAAALVNGLIARLNVGALYARMIPQVGTEATPPIFTAVTDAGLTRVYLRQGPQKTIRDYLFAAARIGYAWLEGYSPFYPTVLAAGGLSVVTENVPNGFPQLVGTNLLDFVSDGHLEESLNTLIWGAQGQALELWGNVTAAANQFVELYTETLTPR